MGLYIQSVFPALITNCNNMLNIIILGTVFISIVILVACCIAKYASKRWKGHKSRLTLGFVLLSSLVAIALFAFFGISVKTIQGIIFVFILLLSSYSDIVTHECDDYLSVMILITAFIGIDLSNFANMVIAAMFTAGIFLLVILTISDGIGGADIKIAVASVFLLGFKRGIIGLIVGLLLAVIINSIKDKKLSFPMIPYLTAAFIPAFFI